MDSVRPSCDRHRVESLREKENAGQNPGRTGGDGSGAARKSAQPIGTKTANGAPPKAHGALRAELISVTLARRSFGKGRLPSPSSLACRAVTGEGGSLVTFLENAPATLGCEILLPTFSVFDDPAHRQRVHRIVTRNGDEMRTVAHDDVFALTHNSETSLFERLHRPEMGIHRARTPVDRLHRSHGDATERSGDRESIFRHLLNRYFHFAHVGTTNTFVYGGKIILDGVANVLHRFLLGFSLRPTTRKRWAIHGVTLFRLMKHDLISEAHRRTLYRERQKLQRTLLPCRSPTKAGQAVASAEAAPSD